MLSLKLQDIMSVRVGPDSILNELPRSVEINGQIYVVSRDVKGSPTIFSTECPHQGGTVEVIDGECLRC